VVGLADLVRALAEKQSLPRRAVVLSFDDGFQDFYESAFPVLREFGFPATVFLVTGHCGGTNGWPGQPGSVREVPLLNWQEVRCLAREGVEFGAHTVTHPDLCRLAPEIVEQEILFSKMELEAQTGGPVRFFSYPYGRYTDEARRIVGQVFEGACGTIMGRIQPDSDVLCLPRIDAFYVKSTKVFSQLFSRSGSLYLGLRSMLRSVRTNR
jgi:peptidoglycan/xylan/chitin deacetylase (PgdA/CDA1 family)